VLGVGKEEKKEYDCGVCERQSRLRREVFISEKKLLGREEEKNRLL
jgi:hypothetical protein